MRSGGTSSSVRLSGSVVSVARKGSRLSAPYCFGIDKSTMSPVIVRLEKRGLVRRKVLADDRRYHALFFAPSAEATFLAARDRVRAFEGSVAARLTKPEQRELARLLGKLQSGG